MNLRKIARYAIGATLLLALSIAVWIAGLGLMLL